MSPAPSIPEARTLLLSPPSLSSHPEALTGALHALDRNMTDLQMLDRLAFGFVSLPSSTYDTVLVLADADDSHSKRNILTDRNVFQQVVQSLKPGGHLQSPNDALQDQLQAEAILAGLIVDTKGGFMKPNLGDQHAVPLRVGKSGKSRAERRERADEGLNVQEGDRLKRTNPPGIALADLTSDFGVDNNADNAEFPDDELINEDALLNGDDLVRPIIQRKSLRRVFDCSIPHLPISRTMFRL